MTENTLLTYLVYYLPYQIPYWLIWATGIILSIRFWRQNPKKFKLSLIAFIVFLVLAIGSFVTSALMFDKFSTSTTSTFQFVAFQKTVSCISIPIEIVAWAILLTTVFSQKFNSIEQS